MIKRIVISILSLASCYIVVFGKNPDVEKEPLHVTIDNSLELAMRNQTVEPLVHIEKYLSPKKGNVWLYWQAYLQMCKSVYYTSVKSESNAKENLESGIQLLEQLQNKTTEDYALLGYMQSQYIRYTKGMESGILSAKSKTNAHKSIEMDSNNIRGWVVLGIIDFYTPKQYGGKEKFEYYLLKAISLPSQNVVNKYRPSWGKIEAYSVLLTYYKTSGQKEKIHKYYNMATKEFPNEPSLKKYETP